MILLAFAIYDEKAKAYLAPFYFHHEGQAARVFTDCLNDPTRDHAFARNPGDYTLWKIGAFDDETGLMTTDSRELMGNGLGYISLSETHETSNVQIRDDTPIQPGPKS